jgi:hypothetical protein
MFEPEQEDVCCGSSSLCIGHNMYITYQLFVANLTAMSGYLFNPLNTELNPKCHLLTLLGAHHILHISRIRVKWGNGTSQWTTSDLYLCFTLFFCFPFLNSSNSIHMNIELRFQQQVCWGFDSSGLSRWVSVLVISNVLKEYTASIFSCRGVLEDC